MIKYKTLSVIKYITPVLALIVLVYAWWFVRKIRDGMPDIEDVQN